MVTRGEGRTSEAVGPRIGPAALVPRYRNRLERVLQQQGTALRVVRAKVIPDPDCGPMLPPDLDGQERCSGPCGDRQRSNDGRVAVVATDPEHGDERQDRRRQGQQELRDAPLILSASRFVVVAEQAIESVRSAFGAVSVVVMGVHPLRTLTMRRNAIRGRCLPQRTCRGAAR